MKLIELTWEPTDRQLRQFAVICLIALPLIGFVWQLRWPILIGLAAVGAVLAVVGFARPKTVRPLYLAMSLVTIPIGIVLAEIVMLSIYVFIFLPISIVFRLMGRDPLQRDLDRKAASYWQPKPQPKHARSYYRQS